MPLFASAPPTAAQVRVLATQQEAFFAKTREKQLAAKALYNHSFPDLADDVPDGLKIHEPSTASSIIDHFRDNVRVQLVLPERDEFGTSKAARERQALLLRIDTWILDKIRRESAVDPFTQTVFDMSLLGDAAWRIRYEPSHWTDQPPKNAPDDVKKLWREERGLRWPFSIQPVDPMGVMPAPGGEWPIPWLVEHQTRTVWELQARYGDKWPNTNNLTPDQTVDWYEFWSESYFDEDGTMYPGWYVCIADGQEVVSMENPYNIVPYVFEYSGMGRIDISGDPSSLAVNMLEKAESEIRAEARLRTAMDAMVQFTAFPRLMTTEDPRALKQRWDLGPGGILQVRGMNPEEKPDWMKQPEMSQALFNLLPTLRNSIERATFSSVMEGQRTPGVDYGYLQSLLVGQASLRKDNIVGMASRMFARGVSLIEQMMVHLELGPFVLGPGTEGEESRTFTPTRHIGNRTDLRVRIEASDPAEKDRKMLAWLQPLRAGVISQRTYLKEGLMLDDPDEEMAQIHAEAVVTQIISSGQIAQSVLADIASGESAQGMQDMAAQRVAQLQATPNGLPASTAGTMPPGQPAPEASPVSSPLSMVKKMQAVNQKATSLQRGA